MNWTNLFKIAFKAISANKLRSFLTTLGIIIGVASVIAMLAIGQGSKRSIRQQISEMGSNMIMINPGADRHGGVRQDASTMQSLKLEDYYSIMENCKNVAATSPTVTSSGQFVYGNENTPSTMYGVSPDYLTIRQLKVEDGEMFTAQDIKQASKVCLLGKTVIKNLFPDGGDPIGKIVRFGNIPFRVIGVLESKGYNSFGMDQDNMALAPYTSVMKRLLAITYLQGINCSAITEEKTEDAIEEITALLRQNHKLKAAMGDMPADADNFTIHSQEEISNMLNTTMQLLTVLLSSVAGISLVVGGIGIMNIMYVSVTERTKEIGLRMSVGARGIDVLAQFLIEAAILSIVGGVIGIVVGAGAAWAVQAFANMPVYVEWWTIVMSFGICTFIGIFFGWYPAQKAARLDPIEALRYE